MVNPVPIYVFVDISKEKQEVDNLHFRSQIYTLENLKKAATDNLPNEDIQILNVDNYLQHKRNRRNINNKRKRSTEAKRRWCQGKLKKKEQDLIEKLKNIELPLEDRFRPYRL